MLTHRQFVLAGNCTFTLQSLATGEHLTFKVKKGKEESAPHFVSLMRGPDNERSFAFLGTIFPDGNYRHGKRSEIGADATSALAFQWVWKNIDRDISKQAKFLPSCQCCRCGRKLTNPASVEMAIGPECAEKIE